MEEKEPKSISVLEELTCLICFYRKIALERR